MKQIRTRPIDGVIVETNLYTIVKCYRYALVKSEFSHLERDDIIKRFCFVFPQYSLPTAITYSMGNVPSSYSLRDDIRQELIQELRFRSL